VATDDIPLQEVPGRFFEQERWLKLKHAFAAERQRSCMSCNETDALEALRPDPSGLFAVARSAPTGTASPVAALNYIAELRDELLADLKAKLQSGEFVATGLLPSGPDAIHIPPELWTDLVVNIPDGIAEGAGYRFQRVRVGRSGPVAQTIAARCTDWMKAQSASFEKLTKKVILHRAKKELGAELTVHAFNAAYREVFQRSRGRPSRQLNKK
jgi:hypothetical protein